MILTTERLYLRELCRSDLADLAGMLEAVFITGGCRQGEGFFCPARQKTAGILGVFQGFLTQQGGKRPALTASAGCEYSFLQDPAVMYAYEGPFSDREVQEWLERQMDRCRRWGFGLWAAVRREDDRMVGQCGLTMQPWKGAEVLEIGCLLLRRHQTGHRED